MNRKKVIEDLVTIVVPAYNAETFLRENIESILGQTYKNLEVIYVCDGCTDDTVEILEEYRTDKRLQVVVQEENQGAAVSRNIGMDMATGDWIIFLDADDVFEPDMIEVMLKAAIENEADIAGCYYQPFDDVPKKETMVHNEMRKHLCTEYPIVNVQKEAKQIIQLVDKGPWTKLVHKSIYKKEEVYFQDLPNTNDVYYSMATVMNAHRISYVDQVLLHYRSDKGRKTLSTARNDRKSYIWEACDKVYAYILSEKKMNVFLQSFYNDVLGNILVYSGNLVCERLIDDLQKIYLKKWRMEKKEDIEHKLSCINRIVYKKILANDRNLEWQDIYRLAKLELVRNLAKNGCSIWGTGQQGEELFKEIEGTDIRFNHVIDSDASKWGTEFHGYRIENFDEIKADNILVTTPIYYEEIKEQIGERAREIYNLCLDIWKID